MEPVRIVVADRVRIRGLAEDVARKVRALFSHPNPRWGLARGLGYAAWSIPRTIDTWRNEPGAYALSVPRGGYRRVRELLDEFGIAAAVRDARTLGDPGLAGEWAGVRHSLPEMRGYQERMIAAAVEKQTCLVRAPTGSGKTIAGLEYARRVGLATLFVVPNAGLFDQWVGVVVARLGIARKDVGMLRAGQRRVRFVTVATQATLARMTSADACAELARFGTVVFDEVQGAAAATIRPAIDPLPARNRLGISADETRRDRLEFLIHDLFGTVACEVSEQEVEASGATVPVEVVAVPTPFDARWWRDSSGSTLEEMAAGGETVRGVRGFEKRFDRLCAEMMASAPRRAVLTETIGRALNGEQVLAFTRRREHARDIAEGFATIGVRVGVAVGGSAADDRAREAAFAGLRDGSVRLIAGTVDSMGTGVDLPEASAGVFGLPILGRQLARQARGRICRGSPGKSVGTLWVLWDEPLFGLTMLRRLGNWFGRDRVFVEDRGARVGLAAFLRSRGSR